MDLRKVLERARESVSAKQVIGEPIERDGITVIPAATVFGGGGGGGGTAPGDESATAGEEGAGPGEGGGFGFGLVAWPAGAFEIRGERVRWEPAVDYTRIALALIAVLALIVRARR